MRTAPPPYVARSYQLPTMATAYIDASPGLLARAFLYTPSANSPVIGPKMSQGAILRKVLIAFLPIFPMGPVAFRQRNWIADGCAGYYPQHDLAGRGLTDRRRLPAAKYGTGIIKIFPLRNRRLVDDLWFRQPPSQNGGFLLNFCSKLERPLPHHMPPVLLQK